MTAEQPPLPTSQNTRLLGRAASVTGNALRDTANDPGMRIHLAHLGGAVLEASGIIHRSASGHRRLSLSGISHAVVKSPKETFGEALGGITAELAPVALYAGATLVSKLVPPIFNRGPKVENAVSQPIAGTASETGLAAFSATQQEHLPAAARTH